MVGFIKTWGTALICAAVIGSVCNMLLPKHSIAKVAKIVVGVYLALVMLTPLLGADLDTVPDSLEFSYDAAQASVQFDEAIAQQSADNIRQKLMQHLAENDILCEDVQVSVSINETGGIYCDEVHIQLAPHYQEKEAYILQLVTTFCGTTPTVSYTEN